MKPLFILASLVLAGSPVLAETGTITASGAVAATCSVGDLDINLSRLDDTKLVGTGDIAISQTGTSKWELSLTEIKSEETPVDPVLVFRGPNNLTIASGSNVTSGEQVINGAFNDQGEIALQLTSITGRPLAPGNYASETTVTCTVQ